ncbi:MAG: type II toxin-antitoxin system RelE/ParE family toxin [Petrimonas sp.]|nr:type II toxin-antitoxin system RelE/ParE family toxin [Petrimonas sp.]
MSVIFLPLAEADLDDIYAFYAEKSTAAAKKIYHAILDEIEILERFPTASPVEPLLDKQSKIFRSLVVAKGLFKVIYFTEFETVYVTHVWCCRQNPQYLRKRY